MAGGGDSSLGPRGLSLARDQGTSLVSVMIGSRRRPECQIFLGPLPRREGDQVNHEPIFKSDIRVTLVSVTFKLQPTMVHDHPREAPSQPCPAPPVVT